MDTDEDEENKKPAPKTTRGKQTNWQNYNYITDKSTPGVFLQVVLFLDIQHYWILSRERELYVFKNTQTTGSKNSVVIASRGSLSFYLSFDAFLATFDLTSH